MKKALIGILLGIIGMTAAQARVYTVPAAQRLTSPFAAANDVNFGSYDLAIDGDSIIIVTRTGTSAAALLYRRGTNGQWRYSRELYREPVNTDLPTPTVVMKNGLAVVKIGAEATFWEKAGGDWRRAATAEPVLLPGKFAISQDRIMAGSSECDNTYAHFYRRNSEGVFAVEGVIRSYTGLCLTTAREVELNYDMAFVREGSDFRWYRRGSGFEWQGELYIYVSFSHPDIPGPPALQNDRVVLPGNLLYGWDGRYWNELKPVNPIDWAAGTGEGSAAVYRDGLLLNADGWDENRSTAPVYIYKKNASGGFDHVGLTDAWASTVNFDISGTTIIAEEYRDFLGASESGITIYNLPANIEKPRAIANNFDARDVSAFTTSTGSQYAIAGNSSNYIYRQSNLDANTSAVLASSNWPDYQSITANVRPTAFSRADAWAGVATRYVDENNYYFVTLGNDDRLRLQRKLNGVVTTLAERIVPVPTGGTQLVNLTANRNHISATLGSGATAVGLSADDASIKAGRAAFLTSGARADFDNLHVAPSEPVRIFSIEPPGWVFGRRFTYSGGAWDYFDWTQEDTSGQAIAVNGLVALSDQSIVTDFTIGSFATTNPVAWVGAIARYRDAQNYYYASLRSSNQVQIRKVVNGVTTVLKAVNFTVTPGQSYRLMFDVLGNELTASIGRPGELPTPVARAIDNDIPTGKFGVGTYRASADFTTLSVAQP